MVDLKFHNTPRGRVLGQRKDMSQITEWKPSVSDIRDTILGWRVVGVNDIGPEADPYTPDQSEVEATAETAYEAVIKGRMIDFGNLPNEVIIDGSNRGGQMYSQGGLPHPFHRPWIAVHTWADRIPPDGAVHTATAVYLISPLEPDRVASNVEVTALDPVQLGEDKMLTIGDSAVLYTASVAPGETYGYDCDVKPAAWRYVPGMEVMNKQGSPERSGASNVLDPFATMMLMLHAVGVRRETIAPSDKLAKARRKSGKPPIPPFDRVYGEQYVTLLQARRLQTGRPGTHGGHHASPIPHIRLGHWRTYADGKRIVIHDTLVNVAPEAREAFVSSRTHYVVPEKK